MSKGEAIRALSRLKAWADGHPPEDAKGYVAVERDYQRVFDALCVPALDPEPVPMVLTCPSCRARHVDEGEFETKPHHTHSCQECGLTWRPAIVPTVGVRFLPGFKNEAPAATFDGRGVDPVVREPERLRMVEVAAGAFVSRDDLARARSVFDREKGTWLRRQEDRVLRFRSEQRSVRCSMCEKTVTEPSRHPLCAGCAARELKRTI